MAVTKATWEALETKIVSDLTDGINISSHSIAGTTVSYRSLNEQRSMLQYVRQQIASLTHNSGTMSLVRFVDA